jgi:hypothetical protein
MDPQSVSGYYCACPDGSPITMYYSDSNGWLMGSGCDAVPACPAGYWSPPGAECDGGVQRFVDSNGKTSLICVHQCTPWTACRAGQSQITAPSPYNDRTCSPALPPACTREQTTGFVRYFSCNN